MVLQKRFLVLGAALFLIGLITGLLPGVMANPRMGLSAHMQGLTNGMFLLALGAAWSHVSLTPKWAEAAFWLLAFGTVANWLATSLAAFWGTGRMTPIISPDPTAAGWQEALVSSLLLALTVAMLTGTIIVLAGFIRSKQ